MTTYKAISEWIAEGVEPVGFVNELGTVVNTIALTKEGLAIKVAPPQPKRLSDEELVEQLLKAARDADTPLIQYDDRVQKREYYRTQILERMKAKGPTRGEVANQLDHLLVASESRHQLGPKGYHKYLEARDVFLSMFPEGE